MNVYEKLLRARLKKYKIKSDFFDSGDSVVVEATGPRIIHYKQIGGGSSATCELSTSTTDRYVFGILKNSAIFFVVNPYNHTRMLLPYETEQQKKSFQKIGKTIFKDNYQNFIYLSTRGLGKQKKRGPKKKKYRSKNQKDDYSITVDDWAFLYFIYGEDVYDLSISQLKSLLECKGNRKFIDTLLIRQDKHAQVARLLYNVSPFQDLSKTNAEMWATPYQKEVRKKVAGKRIEKAKKKLNNKRWIVPKTRKLITDVNLKKITKGEQSIKNYISMLD